MGRSPVRGDTRRTSYGPFLGPLLAVARSEEMRGYWFETSTRSRAFGKQNDLEIQLQQVGS